MAAFNNNKRAVESILVSSGDQDIINNLTTGGTLPGGGVVPGAPFEIPLMSANVQGNVNLNDGQLGIFSASASSVRGLNNALKPADTYLTTPAIYIAQGTANSQSPGLSSYPLINNRPYEQSGIIYGHNPIIMSGKAAFYHTSSLHSIGDPAGGATGSINTEDLTEYSVGVSFSGYAQDTENPAHGRMHTTYHYKTPEYSSLGLVNDLDHIVQNLAFEINRNSRQFRGFHSNWGANDPVVSFAIGLIANGAQDIQAAGFDNGGTINTFIRNGVQAGFPASAEQIATLRSAMPATYGILNIDLTTAGAGANAEFLWILALDRELAYDDRVPQVKITLGVGLRDGFNETVNETEEVTPSEGEGKARQWQLFYENTHGQRKYYQFQRQSWPFIEVPSEITANTYYSVIIIEHRSQAQIDTANVSISPKKTIILMPACEDTTRTALLAQLNAWVKSCPANFLVGQLNATTGLLEIPQPVFCP
jgi:hypothetical protein